jgi:uncharacterized protein (TIGR03663 family)
MKTSSAKDWRLKQKKFGASKKIDSRTAHTSSRERWLFALIVLAVAILLRLLFLDLKPLHHDEGVNGQFMTSLFRYGFYRYDPANYHGPALYYFGLVTTTLDALFYGKGGLSTFAIRLVPAIFGVGIVWLTFSLRRYLGNFAVLAAAALLAVSPGMVYFSRYFIHEIPFVFFTLALVVTSLRYGETKRPKYLMLASASAALMFATKETCIISFAVLLLSWFCTRVYLRFEAGMLQQPKPAKRTAPPASPSPVSPWRERRLLFPLAALVFVCIAVLFYSSFFTNSKGVADSIRTFGIWMQRGAETDQYRAPWSRYIEWLSKEELPILALGILGIILALGRLRNRVAVFSAFWALGITAAYSLLPYKTPWLALNLILPLAIMAGYALSRWHGPTPLRQISAVLVLLIALGASLYQTITLNFFRYDDDSIPYVYAHTSRQLLDLVHELDQVAQHNHTGNELQIAIVSPEFWPLPWYLRNDPHAEFWGHMVETAAPVLIASAPQIPEVEQKLGRLYRQYQLYALRPGNFLVLYLRKDIQP